MFESLVDLVTLKAANYGAKVGQAIAGNLGRGQGGRFTRVGSSDPKLHGMLDRAARKVTVPKKGKGKGSSKLGASQQDAAAEKSGLPKSVSSALRDFASGKPLSPEAVTALQQRGLVDLDSNGKPRLAPNARGLLSALRRGDQRGIEDALSKAGDAQKRADDRKAKADAKASKPKASKGGSSNPAVEARRQQGEQRRKDREAAKAKVASTQFSNALDNYQSTLDHITAADSWTENADALTKMSQVLEVMAAKVDATPGLDDQKKADLHKRIEDQQAAIKAQGEQSATDGTGKTKPADEIRTAKALTVFKQDDGVYRWIVESSNAFKDLEGETIAEAALVADVDRMNEAKEFGPLRWWHVGNPTFKEAMQWDTADAGAGIDIGDCDFAAMVGRILIESGTFRNKEAAEAVAAQADQLQVSRGFSHPIGHPIDGVYTQIRGIERSLLPIGKAANPFTSVLVTKESKSMNIQEKVAAFKALFGGNEDAAKKLLQQVAEKDADLAKVIAFKEGDAPAPAAQVEVKAEGDVSAEGDQPAEGDGTSYVGDMTPDEFAQLIGGILTEALTPLMGAVGKSLNDVNAAATGAQVAAGVVEKQMQAAKEAKDQEIADLKARLAELEGNAPKGKAFVGSQDPDSVVIPGVVLKTLQAATEQAAQGNNGLLNFFATGKVPGSIQVPAQQ